jgi:hypothetical protein
MAKYLLTGCASLFIGLMPVVASAEPMCGERTKIVNELGASYQEVGKARGLISQVQLLEVFVSPDKNWTILISHPDGVSCIMATGQGWEEWNVSLTGAEV